MKTAGRMHGCAERIKKNETFKCSPVLPSLPQRGLQCELQRGKSASRRCDIVLQRDHWLHRNPLHRQAS